MKNHYTTKSIIVALFCGFFAVSVNAQSPALASNEEPVEEENTPVTVPASPKKEAAAAVPAGIKEAKTAAPMNKMGGLPNDRFFIKPHVWAGYNIGKYKSGWGYGGGVRFLYDFHAKFLGGSVFFGAEVSYMAPLGFVASQDRSAIKGNKNFSQQNYLVLPLILEQNYPLFHNTFTIGTGVGYYAGIQANNENAIGLITNIGWFPIYKGKAITPQITYRNDWVFDHNQTNVQSISIAFNF